MVKKQLLKDSGILPLWRLNETDSSETDNKGMQPSVENPAPKHHPETAQIDHAPDWETLEQQVAHCQRCILSKTRTKTVFGVGDHHPDWLFVGEGPGAEEDRRGEPFVGQAGKLLDAILKSLGISRQHHVFIANAVKCRPPENRKPFPEEMDACFPYLEKQIEWLNPKIIVALGATGAQTLLRTDTKIGALRGKVHYYGDIPLIATYHPAYLLRSPMEKSKVWNDLVLALRTLKAKDASTQ